MKRLASLALAASLVSSGFAGYPWGLPVHCGHSVTVKSGYVVRFLGHVGTYRLPSGQVMHAHLVERRVIGAPWISARYVNGCPHYI